MPVFFENNLHLTGREEHDAKLMKPLTELAEDMFAAERDRAELEGRIPRGRDEIRKALMKQALHGTITIRTNSDTGEIVTVNA